MIPDNCNLPQNAKWSDFDDDYTAEEREELEDLKYQWENGELLDEDLVKHFYPQAYAFYNAGRSWSIAYGAGRTLTVHENVGAGDAWHEAAKEILRGIR